MTQRLDPLEIVNTPPPKEDPRPTGMLGAGVNFNTLNQARLAGNPFSVGEDFIQSNLQALQQQEQDKGLFGVGEDLTGFDKDYIGLATGDQRSMSALGQFQTAQESSINTRLQELGLQRVYQGDMYRKYVFNPNTGKYDYIDNTPSLLDQAIPALIKAGVMTAVTGGLSAGLSAATGMGAGMATGLTTGAMTLAQGGDVKDAVVNGLTAGLGEEVKNLNAAVKAGTATKEMVATAEVLNNVKNVANLAQAVESGNVLQAITSGMDLAGLGSVRDVIGQGVQAVAGNNQFINNNLDAITNAVTKITKEGIKGTDPAMMIAKGLWEYGKSGGELPSVNFDFSTGNWDTPEWLKAIDKEALQPIKDSIKAGYDELNDKVLNPIQETADELIRGLPTTKEQWNELEEAYHENIEDPAEEFMQGLNDGFEGSDSPDVDVETPDVDLDLSLDGLGGGSVGDADIVNVILEDPELVSGFQYEELYNPLMGERTI